MMIQRAYKVIVLGWIISAFPLLAAAQNLVKNGSFENFSECMKAIGEIKFANVDGWRNANEGTADYFHSCSGHQSYSSPRNAFGLQDPHTGDTYAGIVVYPGYDGTDGREYILGTLNDTLKKGQRYYFEMFVSFSDISFYLINALGVYFADTFTLEQKTNRIPVDAHITQTYTIDNKTAWQKYSGYYVAKGGEKVLIIGNFEMSATAKLLPWQPGFGYALISYYYIDDVLLTPCYVPDDILPDTTLCGRSALGHVLNATVADSNIRVLDYLWNTGATDPSIAIQDTGLYWVRIQADQCSETDTVRVRSVIDTMDIGSDTIVCVGKPFQLRPWPDEPSAGYRWSTGDTIPSILVDRAGTYWLEANRYGCLQRDSIRILQYPLKEFSLGPDRDLCMTDMVLLDATTDGSTSYLWSTLALASFIYADTSGLYWAEASNGICKFRDSVYLRFHPIPAAPDFPRDTTICSDMLLQLDAKDNSVAHTWTLPPGHPREARGDQVIIADRPGFYKVVNSSHGCISSDSLVVYMDALPELELGSDTTTCGDHILVLSAFSPGASYRWQNSSIASAIAAEKSGVYRVQVKRGACTITDSVKVTVIPRPAFSIGGDSSSCFYQPVLLDASAAGADHYKWQDGSVDPAYSAAQAGFYWVEAMLSGCVFRDSAILTAHPHPSLDLRDTFFCAGRSIALDPGGPYASYTWGNGSSGRLLHTGVTGLYMVTVKNEHGCSDSDSLHVGMKPLPVISMQTRIETCDPDLLLDPGDFSTYLWQDGSTLAVYHVKSYGTYSLIVTDINGCASGTQVEVINRCPSSVHVPNAFTPDGDGLNDLFIPVYYNIHSAVLSIYDRWGRMVFQTTKLTEGWNGKVDGNLLTNGVYTYRITYADINGEEGVEKGNVTLLK